MSWPKIVPVLEANDICRDRMNYGKRHCLGGWSWEVFGFAGPVPLKVNKLLQSAIGTECIPRFNDNRRNSRQQIADVWNQVMRELGYTVIAERE